jgi:hypothetical protein
MADGAETFQFSKPRLIVASTIGLPILTLGVVSGLIEALLVVFLLPPARSMFNTALRIIYVGTLFTSYIGKTAGASPAIEISAESIVDNSSLFAVGTVLWSHVTEAVQSDIVFHQGITLYVDQPGLFISRATGFRREILRLNEMLYGSPIHITTNCLAISRPELLIRIIDKVKLNEEKRQSQPSKALSRYTKPYIENPAR